MLSVLQLCLILSLLVLQLLCLCSQVSLENKEDTFVILKLKTHAERTTITHLIVSPVAVQPMRVHVDDVCADICQEGAVMGYYQDRGRPCLEK